HRLNRGADDIVLRLLPTERTTGGLGVEAEFQAAFIGGAVAIAHDQRPDLPSRPILRDLLEEIVMRVEEETQAGRERVDRQTTLDRPIDIFDTVAKREGEFLDCRRTGFANVIARYRNRIESRHVLG